MEQTDSINDSSAVKVLIVNENGQYLAGTSNDWGFTEERWRARVFDYWQDHVPEMLSLVKNAQHMVWIAVRLEATEAYEFCDQCGRRMTALASFFNGREFLCGSCRAEARARIEPDEFMGWVQMRPSQHLPNRK